MHRIIDRKRNVRVRDVPVKPVQVSRPAAEEQRQSDPVDESDIVVTVLTGGRPRLLAETLVSLHRFAPTLCARGLVLVLHNGSDAATRDVLLGYPWIDEVRSTDDLHPIGSSVTTLFSWASEQADRRFLLHLEDDWRCCRPESEWVGRALQLVDQGFAQVRLRLADERVMTYHALRRTPIRWQNHAGYRSTDGAHYTFNPSLVRLSLADKLIPCSGEPEAMQRFGEGKVAQLVPGAFAHTGGNGLSLADATKGR